MSSLFNPISRQEALAGLHRLQQRLVAGTCNSYRYRGSEGKTLRAQAQQNLQWHQLFVSMNRRACR